MSGDARREEETRRRRRRRRRRRLYYGYGIRIVERRECRECDLEFEFEFCWGD
jgi:hypothetical protein